MKLDKRACRHAANVPLHISLNAGVLYTERVKYLVTAAVKLLGGHRVLAVYFYECERLKANDRMPKWVVFQGKDDFVTLERDAEGNVKWRDSMLENLVDESFYKFRESCVFYKGLDSIGRFRYIHQKVIPRKFCRTELVPAGFATNRQKSAAAKRDKGIVEQNEKIPAAPSNLARWIKQMSCRTICSIRWLTMVSRNTGVLYLLREVFCDKKAKTGTMSCAARNAARKPSPRRKEEELLTMKIGKPVRLFKISPQELLIRIFKAVLVLCRKTNRLKEIYEKSCAYLSAVMTRRHNR